MNNVVLHGCSCVGMVNCGFERLKMMLSRLLGIVALVGFAVVVVVVEAVDILVYMLELNINRRLVVVVGELLVGGVVVVVVVGVKVVDKMLNKQKILMLIRNSRRSNCSSSRNCSRI